MSKESFMWCDKCDKFHKVNNDEQLLPSNYKLNICNKELLAFQQKMLKEDIKWTK